MTREALNITNRRRAAVLDVLVSAGRVLIKSGTLDRQVAGTLLYLLSSVWRLAPSQLVISDHIAGKGASRSPKPNLM